MRPLRYRRPEARGEDMSLLKSTDEELRNQIDQILSNLASREKSLDWAAILIEQNKALIFQQELILRALNRLDYDITHVFKKGD